MNMITSPGIILEMVRNDQRRSLVLHVVMIVFHLKSSLPKQYAAVFAIILSAAYELGCRENGEGTEGSFSVFSAIIWK